jgi:hypothetical protein
MASLADLYNILIPAGDRRQTPVFSAQQNAPGMTQLGDIDIANRPVHQNPDGSISTVRSMSIGEEGNEVLIPTISPNGVPLKDAGAVSLYQHTGQNLGKFRSPADADAYAKTLHDQQAIQYGPIIDAIMSGRR